MKTMQEQVLSVIESTITEQKLTPLITHEWANTGYVYAMAGLTQVARVGFSFQPAYCTLRLDGAGVKLLRPADNPPAYRVERGELVWHHLGYDQGERLQELLDILTHAIIEYQQIDPDEQPDESDVDRRENARFAAKNDDGAP